MNRVIVVSVAVAVVFGLLTFLSWFVIPPWAQGKIDRGEELPLPTQLVMAGGNLWARWFIFIAVAVAVALGFWLSREIRRARA